MRMRFWAMMRSPAFSISALIAPVRLRAVASGLIIEKVRSIAMISSLKSADGSCGAYIDAVCGRQAIRRNAQGSPGPAIDPELQQFHQDEPCRVVITKGESAADRAQAAERRQS